MSTKNKQQLKQEFQSGTKITQAKLEDLIDSSVNKVDDLSIDADGNVGIGTTSVSSGVKLDVAGIARFKTGTNLDIELGTPGGNTGVIFNRSEESNFQRFDIYNRPSDNYFTLCYNDDHSNSNGLYIKKGGNVGIGTTSPSAKLEVNGNMKVTHIVQEDWQDLTLENGWTRFSTTYNPPQYFKDSQGIVHLRGLIKDGTAEEISTLPTAYSPSFRELHIGTTNRNVSCRIDITNAGVITLAADYDNAWVSLDGITFRTA